MYGKANGKEGKASGGRYRMQQGGEVSVSSITTVNSGLLEDGATGRDEIEKYHACGRRRERNILAAEMEFVKRIKKPSNSFFLISLKASFEASILEEAAVTLVTSHSSLLPSGVLRRC